jgi:hypothetical protein
MTPEDAALTILAPTLFVLAVRRGGKVEQLVRARLREEYVPPGTTMVAVPESSPGRRRSLPQELADDGAVLWISNASRSRRSIEAQRWGCRGRTVPATLMPWSSLPQDASPQDAKDPNANAEDPFLVHCTRARSGPWPDQSERDVCEEAFLSPWGEPPSPLETLARILQRQRLVATHRLIRGEVPTVCFSARPLRHLIAMRAFQPHLARWDWEPYGIAIRQSWLVQHGARRVEYLPRREIQSRPLFERTFLQPSPESSADRDWRVEAEWRVPRDLRLSRLPFDQAWVFVPDRNAARNLQPLSRWPILVVHPSTG